MKEVYAKIDADGDYVRAEVYDVDEMDGVSSNVSLMVVQTSTISPDEAGEALVECTTLFISKETLLEIADAIRDVGLPEVVEPLWEAVDRSELVAGDKVRLRDDQYDSIIGPYDVKRRVTHELEDLILFNTHGSFINSVAGVHSDFTFERWVS